MDALHRNYTGVAKEPIGFLGTNGEAVELKGRKFEKWLDGLKKGASLLVTAAHSTDALVLSLVEKGVRIYTAHWHSTGIAKDQTPEKIAAAFSLIDEDKLRAFVARPDLSNLRQRIRFRNAVLEYRKSLMNKLGSLERGAGVSEEKLPTWYTEAKEKTLHGPDLDGGGTLEMEAGIDAEIIKEAKKIPECKLFNTIFGMKNGYIVAGQFVSCVGDISRFPTVSSFWHYCGQHVVDGKAPKRTRGSANDWNPEVRTTLWKTIDAGLKNNIVAIRAPYELFKAAELANHDVKCPECETKLGHCGARARRRVTKELLKKYYVAAGGTGKPQEDCSTSQ